MKVAGARRKERSLITFGPSDSDSLAIRVAIQAARGDCTIEVPCVMAQFSIRIAIGGEGQRLLRPGMAMWTESGMVINRFYIFLLG